MCLPHIKDCDSHRLLSIQCQNKEKEGEKETMREEKKRPSPLHSAPNNLTNGINKS